MAKTATFLLYGDIVDAEDKAFIPSELEYPTVSSKDVNAFIKKNSKAEELVIRINSRGGSVQEGFLIHDLLRNSGKRITTIGEGKIFSIATVIFLAGDKRIMFENADGLIHNPHVTPDNSTYNANQLQQLSEMLKLEEEKILQFYAMKTGADRDMIRDYMAQETMLSASDMVELGFATEIQQPLKAVAYFNLNIKSDEKMNKEDVTKFDGLMAKFEKFVNSFSRLPVKNMDITSANGDIFHVVREEGDIAVGDEASPDGEFVMEDGTKVVIAGGKIETIEKAADEGEEMKALKAENEALKAKLAEFEKSSNEARAEVEALKSQQTEVMNVYNELKTLRSKVVIEDRTQNFKSTKKADAVDISKVQETLNKIKEGK